ncbi:hypothetical protein C2S51_037831 [Perilla frutescens var. frutescens]|nr:hypothetical protein C2S51_037831 [Perilla frutescens var. frutescens]
MREWVGRVDWKFWGQFPPREGGIADFDGEEGESQSSVVDGTSAGEIWEGSSAEPVGHEKNQQRRRWWSGQSGGAVGECRARASPAPDEQDRRDPSMGSGAEMRNRVRETGTSEEQQQLNKEGANDPYLRPSLGFEEEISLVEMPPKFTFPSMKLFDGTTNPDNHIAQYKQRMFTTSIPRQSKEAGMYKGFGSSLSGPALQWFTNLPNSSISTFAQLNDLFVEQFASSRKIEKHADDLYTVIQRQEKTLRSFVGRFNREKVSILGCNIDTTVSAFRKGLKRGSDLYKELTKYPCKTMEDVLAKAWAQIKWEEDEANLFQFRPRNDPPHKEHRPHIRNERYRADPYPRNSIFDPRDRRIPEHPDRRLPEYNLCITPSEAVNAMKGLGKNVKWPPKMRTLDNERDRNKFCDFHNNHGHRTDNCIALRLEVIELLKRGHLTDLLTSKGKEN